MHHRNVLQQRRSEGRPVDLIKFEQSPLDGAASFPRERREISVRSRSRREGEGAGKEGGKASIRTRFASGCVSAGNQHAGRARRVRGDRTRCDCHGISMRSGRLRRGSRRGMRGGDICGRSTS
jgi:hypothetical protein